MRSARCSETRSAMPTRVDEDQRRAMLARKLRDAVVDLVPHLVGGDRSQFDRRNFDGKIEFALVAHIDDDRGRDAQRR